MKKNCLFIFLFTVAVLFSSCVSIETVEEDMGVQGYSYKNPNIVVVKEKVTPDTVINGGEFYRFDFKSFKEKEGKYAIVDVLDQFGNTISLYSIGYHKKHFYDTFYISPNAAKINVALSDSESSYKKIKGTYKVETPETALYFYPVKEIAENIDGKDVYKRVADVTAGTYVAFDFSVFHNYYGGKDNIENRTTYGVVECYGDYGRLMNKVAHPAIEFTKGMNIHIPAKTQSIRLAVSSSDETYYTPIDVFSVSNTTPYSTIDSFMAGSFRTLDLNKYKKNIKNEYGIIEYLDKNYKPIFTDSVENDGNGNVKGKVYIPRDAVYANLAFSSSQLGYRQTFDYIDILPSSNQSPLISPSSLHQATKTKTPEINPKIAEFIKYLNIETFNRDNSEDLFIDYVVTKVDELATNDYERVKLYHDAVLCTLTGGYSEWEEIKYKKQMEILPEFVEKSRELSSFVIKNKIINRKYRKAKKEFYQMLEDSEDNFRFYSIYFVPYKAQIETAWRVRKKYKSDREVYKEFVELNKDAIFNYVKTLENYNNPSINYKQVLKTRRSVVTSDAYALLFNELCERKNIPCIVVSGHQKKHDSSGFGWTIEDGIYLNHYWNIVVINNESYIVDVSMDAAEIKGPVKYSSKYLFIDPKESIYINYPANDEFQLLKKTLPETEYILIDQKKAAEEKKKNEVLEKSSEKVEESGESEEIEEVELSKKELKKLEKQAKKEAKEKAKQEKKAGKKNKEEQSE